jgi:hypothetical protein
VRRASRGRKTRDLLVPVSMGYCRCHCGFRSHDGVHSEVPLLAAAILPVAALVRGNNVSWSFIVRIFLGPLGRLV